MNPNESVAIVTGAGGGVGRAISKRLFSEGAKIVMVGRDLSKLTTLARECGDENRVLPIRGDITKESDVVNIIEQTISVFDRVDILINSAGTINEPKPFQKWLRRRQSGDALGPIGEIGSVLRHTGEREEISPLLARFGRPGSGIERLHEEIFRMRVGAIRARMRIAGKRRRRGGWSRILRACWADAGQEPGSGESGASGGERLATVPPRGKQCTETVEACWVHCVSRHVGPSGPSVN